MKKIVVTAALLACCFSLAFAGQNESRNNNYSGQTTQSSSYTGQHSGGADYGTPATFNASGSSGAARDTSTYSTSPASGTINNTNSEVRSITNRISDDN